MGDKECIEWIESDVHSERVQTNLLWIAIILSFVGCSCLSMICGFVTMYHIEILTCFVDHCSQCTLFALCCDLAIDEDDDEYDEHDEIDKVQHNDTKQLRGYSPSSSTSGDGYKYNQDQHAVFSADTIEDAVRRQHDNQEKKNNINLLQKPRNHKNHKNKNHKKRAGSGQSSDISNLSANQLSNSANPEISISPVIVERNNNKSPIHRNYRSQIAAYNKAKNI